MDPPPPIQFTLASQKIPVKTKLVTMLLNDDTQFHKKTKKTPNTPRLNVSLRYRLPLLHTLVISDGTRKRIESSASPDPSISEDLIIK
jgi:hypothetical protein